MCPISHDCAFISLNLSCGSVNFFFFLRKEYERFLRRNRACVFQIMLYVLAAPLGRQKGSMRNHVCAHCKQGWLVRRLAAPCSLLLPCTLSSDGSFLSGDQTKLEVTRRKDCCHLWHLWNSLQCIYQSLHFPAQGFIPYNLTFNKSLPVPWRKRQCGEHNITC